MELRGLPGPHPEGVPVHSHHNGLKTAALLGLLSALILALGYAFGGSGGLIFAVFLSLALNAGTYFFSDKLALRSMRAQPVTEAQFPALYQIVRELSSSAGQPMPSLYVSPTMQPNAFATGRNPQHAAVAVTQGITQMLDRRELRAVIGHELSHVSSVAGALAGIITSLAHLAIFLPLGGSDDDDRNPAAILLMLILGPLAAMIIQMAISRSREFQADADGARLSGDPLALASALEKISYGAQRLPLPAQGNLNSTAHLMIANPFRAGGISKLFSTHPPMQERIARLREQAGAIQYRR
jgi:heat shock protein HtpX